MGKFIDEGNIFVMNQSKNVLVNYNFMLRVEGVYDLPCKAVHSFTKENEFEYVQEGGLNDYVHMLRKPVSKPFSFTVERYVGMDIIPPLQLGAELVLPVILMVAPNANQFGNAKRTFVFTGCTIMSKTYGELNAEKSDLLTETIVIGYREMTEVTVPVHMGSDGKLWQFDGNKVEGNGQRSASDGGIKVTEPEVRRWSGKKEDAATSVRSASDGGIKATKPQVRRWSGKVEEDPSTKSAKTLKDIYGEEQSVADAEAEAGTEEGTVNSAAQPLPRVKKGPDTGKAEVRRWSGKKGEEESSTRSAKTLVDILGEEAVKNAQESGISLARKWPETKSAKPEVDTKEVEKRKWKPDVSARPEVDTKEVEKRKWKPDVSARPQVDTKEVEKRKWKPDVSARPQVDTKEAKKRKWPPTQSAKKK